MEPRQVDRQGQQAALSAIRTLVLEASKAMGRAAIVPRGYKRAYLSDYKWAWSKINGLMARWDITQEMIDAVMGYQWSYE